MEMCGNRRHLCLSTTNTTTMTTMNYRHVHRLIDTTPAATFIAEDMTLSVIQSAESHIYSLYIVFV